MTKTTPFTKNDIFLLTLLVILGVTLSVWIYFPSSPGNNILEVRLNGQVQMSLPLNENTEQKISGADGATNRFLIQDGSVKMTEASCHDHTCIDTGSIHNAGETIVCLPHRLVLAIVTSGDNEHQPDAIVQ